MHEEDGHTGYGHGLEGYSSYGSGYARHIKADEHKRYKLSEKSSSTSEEVEQVVQEHAEKGHTGYGHGLEGYSSYGSGYAGYKK